MARIDYTTQTTVQQEYFSDFLSTFDKSPLSNDLARLTDAAAIRQSVRNLVLTNLGERLFEPNVGSTVYKSLFDNFSQFTAQDIKNSILNTINYNEKRAYSVQINVIDNSDGNSLTVNIVFLIFNNPTPISLDLVIQRVR